MEKTAQLIDGKKLAEDLLLQLRRDIIGLDRKPGLAVVMAGDDPASRLFIKRKKEAAKKVGIIFHDYYCSSERCLPNITEGGVLELIDWLNNDKSVDGIIIQLPIPEQFNTETVIKRMAAKKDADGFHPDTYEALLNDQAIVDPPLISAIRTALEATKENVVGKQAAVIGKSSVFSRPLAHALEKIGLRVEVVNPDAFERDEKIKQSDVLVSIVGRRHFITPEMVKVDAIVLDAGTVLIDGKTYGDVDPAVAKVASWLTPVPGGIGPLTVAFLLRNVYELAKRKE